LLCPGSATTERHFRRKADGGQVQLLGTAPRRGLNTKGVGSVIVENGGTAASTLTVNHATANTFGGILQDGTAAP